MKRLMGLATLITLLISTSAHAEVAVANCDKAVNIRQRPDISSPVVGYLKDGSECDTLLTGDDWSSVKSGTVTGYVMKKYLVTGDKATERVEAEGRPYLQTKEVSNIHESRSVNSRIWDHTNPQMQYDVLSVSGDWVEIDLYGASGYVQNTETVVLRKSLPQAQPKYAATSTTPTRQALVTSAMRYLGGTYIWGGNDPNIGADCSGFVKYFYKNIAGINLPRTSYTMCYSGASITSTSMQPGDLIFYANASGTVHHVAMYAGNGTVIHAASTKSGIIVSPWNYQTPKYIRRILEN